MQLNDLRVKNTTDRHALATAAGFVERVAFYLSTAGFVGAVIQVPLPTGGMRVGPWFFIMMFFSASLPRVCAEAGRSGGRHPATTVAFCGGGNADDDKNAASAFGVSTTFADRTYGAQNAEMNSQIRIPPTGREWDN